MEAEFVSCFEVSSHGVWFKSFISGLRIVDFISRPLKLYCDNSTAVFMAKNNKSGSRSKHIDIKYLSIRERVKEKKLVIEHICTESMLADPLTNLMKLACCPMVVQMGLGSMMQFNCTYIHYFNETLIQSDIFSYGFVHFILLLLLF